MENIELEILKLDCIITGQVYNRAFYLTVNDTVKEFTKYLECDEKHKINLNGIIVKTSTNRIKNIITNINNFRNDIKPFFFSIESNLKDENYHINLYGINLDGKIVMLNQNDIIGKIFREQ